MDNFYIKMSGNKGKLKENTTNQSNYYTSKEFNFYDMIFHLKNNPDWMAKCWNKMYRYATNGLVEVIDNDWLNEVTPNITYGLLHNKFTLIPPKPNKQWIDIDANEVITMIVNDNVDKDIRVKLNNGDSMSIGKETLEVLSVGDILTHSWQQLKEVI